MEIHVDIICVSCFHIPHRERNFCQELKSSQNQQYLYLHVFEPIQKLRSVKTKASVVYAMSHKKTRGNPADCVPLSLLHVFRSNYLLKSTLTIPVIPVLVHSPCGLPFGVLLILRCPEGAAPYRPSGLCLRLS